MDNAYIKQYFTKAYWADQLHTFIAAVKTPKFWNEMVYMTGGMLIGAISVYYFLMPSHLIVGCISGLSIVINTIIGGDADSFSLIVTLINAFLLLMAFILIGNEFGAKTVYTALILGPLIQLCDRVYPSTNLTHAVAQVQDPDIIAQLQQNIQVLDSHGNPYVLNRSGELLEQVKDSVMSAGLGMGDVLFDLICFVLLLSLCQTLLFRINASSGGLDIIAKIVNKYMHFDMGMSVTIAGAIICCTSFAINDFRMVVIGLIGTWVNGIVVNYFTNGINNRKRVCIISEDAERIRKFIINDLVRGCSLYDVTGGYSGKHFTEIQVMLTKDEFARLYTFLKKEHIHTFTTVGNCSEIYGTWKRQYKIYHKGGYVIEELQ